jgi:hypothetical protein
MNRSATQEWWSVAEVVETGEQVALCKHADVATAIDYFESRLRLISVRELADAAGAGTLALSLVTAPSPREGPHCVLWSWRWRRSWEEDDVSPDDAAPTSGISSYRFADYPSLFSDLN